MSNNWSTMLAGPDPSPRVGDLLLTEIKIGSSRERARKMSSLPPLLRRKFLAMIAYESTYRSMGLLPHKLGILETNTRAFSRISRGTRWVNLVMNGDVCCIEVHDSCVGAAKDGNAKSARRIINNCICRNELGSSTTSASCLQNVGKSPHWKSQTWGLSLYMLVVEVGVRGGDLEWQWTPATYY
jgi:hypothetical protein